VSAAEPPGCFPFPASSYFRYFQLKEGVMHRRTLIASSAALAVTTLGTAAPAGAQTMDPENTIYLDLKQGRVVIKLLPEVAPKTVAQIKTLARQGFYDGTPFHRVIEGFMAQGGDPTGSGTGGSKLPDLPLEASERHFVRGVCGMARASDPNSGNSQFFIMFAPAPSLDGQYTIWGQVVSGMEYVDEIKRGAPGSGIVTNPDRIVHMRVAADVK
jgi:peptidylprolyl isomerase